MYDYKKYLVWQKAHQLFLNTYAVTKKFPDSEKYNLTSQINRAILSIPTNIAKGSGRNSQKEFIRFLNISSGSATELDYLFLAAKDLGFICDNDYVNLISKLTEVRKMIFALIQKISSTLN